MDHLEQHIEALIFCTESPIEIVEIQKCLNTMFESKIPLADIENSISNLQSKYIDKQFSFSIENIGNGYQFLTKPAYQASISNLLKQKSTRKLSNSALETLSIIAYKQPTTKTDIEQIRGVNSDYSVQKLLEKELIEIKGKSESVGRPLLYGTSSKFMDYFGINSLKELPDLKELEVEENSIGEQNEQ